MALITCPECGRTISEYADFCVGCGCSMDMIELLNGEYAKRSMVLFLNSVFSEERLIGSFKNIRPSIEYLQVIKDVLRTLTPREEKVMLLRFGFEGGHLHSYEELSAIWKEAPERICQIEEKALMKLRHPSREKNLKIILEYPAIDTLRHAAEKQGYLPWTEEDARPFIGEYSAFSKYCFEFFGLYDPSAHKHLTDITLTNYWKYDIEALDLGVRSYNCLKREGIDTVSELVELSTSKLRSIRNLGQKGCEEIIAKLAAIGLELK